MVGRRWSMAIHNNLGNASQMNFHDFSHDGFRDFTAVFQPCLPNT